MKKFYTLKPKQIVYYIGVLVLGYSCAVAQKYFIPDNMLLRSGVLLAAIILLFYFFFAIVKPENPFSLSKTAALLNAIIVSIIIAVQHFIITFTPSIKNIIVLGIVIAVPFIDGVFFSIISTKRRRV